MLHLGRAHQLSAYDAPYLELAVRRGIELASLDDKLKAAASALGVALFTRYRRKASSFRAGI